MSYPWRGLAATKTGPGVDRARCSAPGGLPPRVAHRQVDAHEGKGLGDRFLRHAERTRVLLHVVDVSKNALSPPDEAYGIIRREIEAGSPKPAAKPEIVVANKMDAAGAKKGIVRLRKVVKVTVSISALDGQGIRRLVAALDLLQRARAAARGEF